MAAIRNREPASAELQQVSSSSSSKENKPDKQSGEDQIQRQESIKQNNQAVTPIKFSERTQEYRDSELLNAMKKCKQPIQIDSLSNKKLLRSSSSRKAANQELVENGKAIAQVGGFQYGSNIEHVERLRQPGKKLGLEEKAYLNMSPPRNGIA